MKFYLKENILLIALTIISINIFQMKHINAESESCDERIENKVVMWSILKIKESNLANYESISCDFVQEMNKMVEDKILITSGRKRGKPLICISDDNEYPCKFIIGSINPGIDSSEAIKQIYSFTTPKSSQFNETVERLFLNPSSLIQ